MADAIRCGVVGHLAFVEGLTHEMLGGGSNPVGDWASLFGQDTVPTRGRPRGIQPCAKSARQYVQLRKRNLQLLESMTEADLDKPTPWQPKGTGGALRELREGSVDGRAAPDGRIARRLRMPSGRPVVPTPVSKPAHVS